MDYETVKISKVSGKCPACEKYAKQNSTTSPKVTVMACEGACARREVASLAAHRAGRYHLSDSRAVRTGIAS